MAAVKSKRGERFSVQEVCIRRLGLHRGAIAAARVAQLAIAQRDLGHWPTAVEYAEYWSVIERTAWNHRAAALAGVVGPELEGDDALAVLKSVVDTLVQAIDRSETRSTNRKHVDARSQVASLRILASA